MPHAYYLSSLKSKNVMFNRYDDQGREGRRASPVILHVSKVRGDRGQTLYVGRVIWFKAVLIGKGDSIAVGERRDLKFQLRSDRWKAVGEFLHGVTYLDDET
jgi:hypothetical protein